jgi:hypothetical protein
MFTWKLLAALGALATAAFWAVWSLSKEETAQMTIYSELED